MLQETQNINFLKNEIFLFIFYIFYIFTPIIQEVLRDF